MSRPVSLAGRSLTERRTRCGRSGSKTKTSITADQSAPETHWSTLTLRRWPWKTVSCTSICSPATAGVAVAPTNRTTATTTQIRRMGSLPSGPDHTPGRSSRWSSVEGEVAASHVGLCVLVHEAGVDRVRRDPAQVVVREPQASDAHLELMGQADREQARVVGVDRDPDVLIQKPARRMVLERVEGARPAVRRRAHLERDVALADERHDRGIVGDAHAVPQALGVQRLDRLARELGAAGL